MKTPTQSQTQTESETKDTEQKATYWLKPGQIDALRSATVGNSMAYLAARNDALIAVMADSGLRVNETRLLDVSMLDLDDGVVTVPASIQKDYPNENSPSTATIGLADETVRTLRMYLNSRWKDSDALFPSRQNDRISNQSIRDMVRSAARDAEVRPWSDEGKGSPEDVTPHTLRHSVAYRMLRREGKTIYDVKSRLRHASIVTTDKVYSHLDVV